jgi:hypothetical protein
MYAQKIRSISGLCLAVLAEEPSAEDYLNWLSEEVSGLLDVFSSVNENFAIAAIEGGLALAGDSVDLEDLRAGSFKAGADILAATSGVQRAARAISKKWWRSFGDDYVLSTIHAQRAKVLSCFWVLVCAGFLPLLSFSFRPQLGMKRSTLKLRPTLLSLTTWRLLLTLSLQGSWWRNAMSPVVLLVSEVLKMLVKVERRCDFGMSLTCHVIYSHFVDSVNFGCHAQASQLFEPAQVSSSHLVVTKPIAGGVDVSSSGTEDLLNLLFLSPACDSPFVHYRASSDTDSFESWLEANDMAASVYVALSVDASSSRKPAIDAPCDTHKSHFHVKLHRLTHHEKI